MKKVKVRQYDMELDEFKHPKLVLLKEFDYCRDEKEKFDYIAVSKMICSCLRLADKAEEYVYAAAYTLAGGLLGVFELNHGSNCSSRIHFRELMQRMWLVGAGGFILIHNHPSGDPTPSNDDIESYKDAVRMGEFFETQCLDFIIVGRSFDEGQCAVYSFTKEKMDAEAN